MYFYDNAENNTMYTSPEDETMPNTSAFVRSVLNKTVYKVIC